MAGPARAASRTGPNRSPASLLCPSVIGYADIIGRHISLHTPDSEGLTPTVCFVHF